MMNRKNHSGNALLEHVRDRENLWEKSLITSLQREEAYGHKPMFIVITSSHTENEINTQNLGLQIEKKLIQKKYKVFYLKVSSPLHELDTNTVSVYNGRDEHIRRIGELARIFTDAGQVFITSVLNLTANEIKKLRLLNHPNEILIINTAETSFGRFQRDTNIDDDNVMDTICSLL